MIEFSVLGPVEVRRDGAALGLGGSQQRRLMAVLLTNPGQVVSLDRLEEAVWPNGDAPDGSRRAVMTYISRLRSVLGNRYIATHGPGYQLEPGDETIDAVVFERLLSAARQTAPTLRVATLDQALSMWRGSAFGEFADEWWARPTASRLEELRLVAVEDRVEALLDAGDTERAVSDLEGFVAACPLRERPVGQLIRALSATGRRPEALRAFHDFRERLAEQTGLDPSLALVELERQIAAGLVPDTPRADRVARGYVLGDVLGEGSFGTVFRATQPGVGREVAVKVIRAERADNADFVQRFETEAQLVARLEHPHIVPLYDFWREPGGAYLVFRLLRGGNAEQALLTDGAWSFERVSRLVDEIGGALGVAHAAGVIHRDVKPANILFDEIGNAHLSDFGIALTDSVQQDGTPYSAGSPLYASPEQFLRQPVSAKSDLYSFAAMLWELLTGVPPFEGVSASVVERIKLERPVPSLRQWRPELAGVIDAVFQRATAVRPKDRYASAHDLMLAWRVAAEHLRSASTGDPLAASNGPRVASTMLEFAAAGANPYKGLRAFGEADAREYFGRSSLIDDLYRMVNVTRAVMVVGPSGSGKSSLLHAGLLPRLRYQRARVVAMVPTDRPSAQLRTALLAVATRPLSQNIDDAVDQVAREAESELIVLIDQFEELWTLTTDTDERDRFVQLLSRFAGDPASNVRMVLAIRADFFDRPLADPLLGPHIATNVFTVTPMTAAELSEAVRAPANAVGVSFEPGLDAEIVADVASHSASLPLLQFALAELYERRSAALIPTVAYREMGGVAGAIAARAEAVFSSLDAPGQREARRLFSRLVTPGGTAEDTRRRARRSEMPESANAIADQFVTHRLLVVDRDAASREPTIDIAHEALLTRWPRLRSWLDEDREQLQLMQHLSRAADEWEEAGRRETDLYRGPRLSLMGEVNNSGNVILAPVEEEFLDASWSAHATEERQEQLRVAQQARQNRRLRRALVGAGIMLIIAVLAGSVALVQRNRADDQRNTAIHAQAAEAAARARGDIDRMIAQSRADAIFDPTRAALLAVEAYRRSESHADKLQAAGAVQSVLSQQSKGHLGSITGEGPYSFANYGNTVIVAKNGERVSVWDASTWKKQRDFAVETEVTALALSGDDRYVAVTTPDRVSVYAVATGEREAQLNVGFLSTGVVFDHTDSARIVIGRAIGTSFWLPATNPIVQILRWRTNHVELEIAVPALIYHNRLSPDGRVLVTGHNDAMVRMWDAHTGALLAGPLISGSLGGLAFATIGLSNFSPDGTMVASHSLRGMVRVWSVPSGQLVTKLDLPIEPWVESVAFVGNERIMYDQFDLFEYNLRTGVRRFYGTDSPLNGAISVDPTFSAVAIGGGLTTRASIDIVALDQRQVGARQSVPLPPGFSTGQVGGDRLSVDATGRQLLAFDTQAHMLDLMNPSAGWRTVDFPGDGVLTIASFSRDGRFIVTQHTNANRVTASLWDPTTLRSVVSVPIPARSLAFSFSPDYRLLASTNRDLESSTSVVHVYDVATGARLETLTDFDAVAGSTTVVANQLSFSADSKRLAAATLTGSVGLVWDLDTGAVHSINNAFQVEFDRAGRYLVTLSLADKVVYLLDAVTLKVPVDLAPISGRASSRALSHPTEPLLLTDGTCFDYDSSLGFRALQLFDTEAGREIGIGLKLDCAFWFPDGKSFMGKDDTSIQIWDTDPERWVEAGCRFAGRNLSTTEWQRYGPNAPYRQTCP